MLCAVGTGIDFAPPSISMALARREAEMVLFESVSEALRESNMHPRQVPHQSHSGWNALCSPCNKCTTLCLDTWQNLADCSGCSATLM